MDRDVFTVLVLPLAVAGIAVLTRGGRQTTQWIAGFGIIGLLTLLAFGSASEQPLQALRSSLFVVIVPVGATFWVASRRRFTPLVAFGMASAAYLAGLALGIILGVNIGILRP